MKAITRVIFVLSLVSLFNDIASEMLVPIMPIYLKAIGFNILLIGILEGVAEATASLSKGYFGKLSDTTGKRMPFVRWGYALSTVARPMMGLLIQPISVFFFRTAERFGKGVRTAPRDAMLSVESAKMDRGRVFGFHRSMDTMGAVLGTTFALVFLYFNHGHYRTLFYFSFFPGITALALTFLVKDEPQKRGEKLPHKWLTTFFTQFKYWKKSPAEYKKLIVGLLFFALFNSADAFLILKLKQAGSSDTTVIIVYIFYNLVYAFLSFPIGILADRIGLKKIVLTGLFAFSIVYFGMSTANSKIEYVALFLIYGLYYACTEGIEKAWISKICEKRDMGTALGMFSGLQSICALLASTLAGLVWYGFGPTYVFVAAGAAALLACVYLAFVKEGQVR